MLPFTRKDEPVHVLCLAIQEVVRGADDDVRLAALVCMLARYTAARAVVERHPDHGTAFAEVVAALHVETRDAFLRQRSVKQLLAPCRFCRRAFDDPRGHDPEVDHVEHCDGR